LTEVKSIFGSKMLLKLAIILAAASITIGSKAKHNTKKVEKEDAKKSRQNPDAKLTWEECVEFHFDGCDPGGKTPSWDNYNNQGENECLENCQRCTAECPPKTKCGAMINNVLDRLNPNPLQPCWKTDIVKGRTLTDSVCSISWGTVKKGPNNRYALRPCISGNGVRCNRGKCNMDGHLTKIPMANALFLPTEEECMDSCWSHSNPNEGDCTHYKWTFPNKGDGDGECFYYKRKNLTDLDTNYKCDLYSLTNNPITLFGIQEIAACKSGGQKYYKGTSLCGQMCNATLGDQARIEFPVAMIVDTSGSQSNTTNRDKVFELINTLNLTKAASYQLLEYGTNQSKTFTKKTNYAEFKADLDSLTFPGNGTVERYTFFAKGLKPMCEKADPNSFILAIVDETTNNGSLEEEIAKCLIDKKATLFIALNPAFTPLPESYTKLAEGSGGKVVNIANDIATLVTAIDTATNIFCGCDLDNVEDLKP